MSCTLALMHTIVGVIVLWRSKGQLGFPKDKNEILWELKLAFSSLTCSELTCSWRIRFQKLNNVLNLRWRLSADVDSYNTRERTQIFKMSRQNPRSCQDIQGVKTKSKILSRYLRCQDKIQDLVKIFKMSTQNPRTCQGIQDVKTKSKILPRYSRSKIWPRFPRSKVL